MASTRILLVEDEPLWQQGIQTLLSMTPGYDFVGFAEDYETALKLFEEQKPDIVLLDWKIKGVKDGLAVGQALLEAGFSPDRIVLVSGSEKSLIPANPYHYVPKSRISSDLTNTLEEVLLITG